MGNIVVGTSWVLAAALVIVAVLEVLAPRAVRKSYSDVGIPSWLRVVLGVVKCIAGAMLLLPGWRVAGAAIGVTVCASSFVWFALGLRLKLALLSLATMLALTTIAALSA